MGLLGGGGDPVLAGLLSMSPQQIKAMKMQQAMQGGRAPSLIGTSSPQQQPQANMGQGLTGLGQGLASLAGMVKGNREQEAFNQAVASLPDDQQAIARMNPEAFTKAKAASMFAKDAEPGFQNIVNPKTGEAGTVRKGQTIPVGFVIAGDAALTPKASKPMNIVNPKTSQYRTINEGEPIPAGWALGGAYSPPAPKDPKEPKGAFGEGATGSALDIVSRIGIIPEGQRTQQQQAQLLSAQWFLSQPRTVSGPNGGIDVVYPTALPQFGGAPMPVSQPASGSAGAAPGSAPQPPAQPGGGVGLPGVPSATAAPTTGPRVETLKAPTERDDRVSPTETTKGLELRTMIQSGEASIDNLRRALELNDKAYSGPTANLYRSGARMAGLDPDGVAATTEFENIILNNVLTQLKATFGGNPTEGERKILEQVSGSLTSSRGERRAVLNNAISVLNRRITSAKDNLKALGSGTVTSAPGQIESRDFSGMTLDEIIKIDPSNFNESEAKAYTDRMKTLGVPGVQ